MSNDIFAEAPVIARPQLQAMRINPPQFKREIEKPDTNQRPVTARLAQGGPGAPLTVKQDGAKPITLVQKQPTGTDPRAVLALLDRKR